ALRFLAVATLVVVPGTLGATRFFLLALLAGGGGRLGDTVDRGGLGSGALLLRFQASGFRLGLTARLLSLLASGLLGLALRLLLALLLGLDLGRAALDVGLLLADLDADGLATGHLQGLGGLALQGDLARRSEEHTSELQSREYLVCRLLLDKK